MSPKFQKRGALKFVGRTIPSAKRRGIINTNKISPRPSLRKRGKRILDYPVKLGNDKNRYNNLVEQSEKISFTID